MSGSFGVAEVVQQLKIASEPAKVWKALTEQIGDWWPDSFYTGKAPRRFVLELELGGRMFEDWGKGQGLVWKTVTGFVREEWLMLSGELWPEFGGPAHEYLKLELAREGKSTVLRWKATIFGITSAATRQSIDEGWMFLFGEGLKAFVEKR